MRSLSEVEKVIGKITNHLHNVEFRGICRSWRQCFQLMFYGKNVTVTTLLIQLHTILAVNVYCKTACDTNIQMWNLTTTGTISNKCGINIFKIPKLYPRHWLLLTHDVKAIESISQNVSYSLSLFLGVVFLGEDIYLLLFLKSLGCAGVCWKIYKVFNLREWHFYMIKYNEITTGTCSKK